MKAPLAALRGGKRIKNKGKQNSVGGFFELWIWNYFVDVVACNKTLACCNNNKDDFEKKCIIRLDYVQGFVLRLLHSRHSTTTLRHTDTHASIEMYSLSMILVFFFPSTSSYKYALKMHVELYMRIQEMVLLLVVLVLVTIAMNVIIFSLLLLLSLQ